MLAYFCYQYCFKDVWYILKNIYQFYEPIRKLFVCKNSRASGKFIVTQKYLNLATFVILQICTVSSRITDEIVE